jgi:hypothetical protein
MWAEPLDASPPCSSLEHLQDALRRDEITWAT